MKNNKTQGQRIYSLRIHVCVLLIHALASMTKSIFFTYRVAIELCNKERNTVVQKAIDRSNGTNESRNSKYTNKRQFNPNATVESKY